MSAKCINPNCPNDVPEGWEGGYCVACCNAIEDAEAERHYQMMLEEEPPPPVNHPDEIFDPYAEYGFDHPWER